MILHPLRCVFFHIPKTAGYAMEQALAPGDRDYIQFDREHLFGLHKGLMTQHMPYASMLDYVPRATLDAYFKFAFTRNTWDRLVSAYCYSKPIYEAKHGSFESWIGDVCERVRTSRYKPGEHFAPQSDYLEHEGREALDFVGSFENLQQDWRHVCDRLELPPCPLPRLNRTRSKQGHYSACYTDRTRDLVAEAYAREISRMDYRFERR